VWSYIVAVSSPILDSLSCFIHCFEQVLVQKVVPEFSIEAFGKSLVQIRKEREISQEVLALKSGMGRTY